MLTFLPFASSLIKRAVSPTCSSDVVAKKPITANVLEHREEKSVGTVDLLRSKVKFVFIIFIGLRFKKNGLEHFCVSKQQYAVDDLQL